MPSATRVAGFKVHRFRNPLLSYFLFALAFLQANTFAAGPTLRDPFKDWTVYQKNRTQTDVRTFNKQNKSPIGDLVLTARYEVADSLLKHDYYYRIISNGEVTIYQDGALIYSRDHDEIVPSLGLNASKHLLGKIVKIRPVKKNTILIIFYRSPEVNKISLFFNPLELRSTLVRSQVNALENYCKVIACSFLFLLGLIFMLLFIFHRSIKYNLYFALFCFSISVLVLNMILTSRKEDFINPDKIQNLLLTFLLWFSELTLLLFINYFISGKVSKSVKWINLINLFLMLAFVLIYSFQPFNPIATFLILLTVVITTVELFRQIIIGLRKKKREARVVGTALLVSAAYFVVMLIIDFAGSFGTIHAIGNIEFDYMSIIYLISGVLFPVFMGVNLAADYARNVKLLAKQIETIKELSERSIAQEKEKQEMLLNQNELLEQQVRERTAEISAQNKLITEQKEEVEQKQKEILDSIYYARRIQRSLLPTEKYLIKVLAKFAG